MRFFKTCEIWEYKKSIDLQKRQLYHSEIIFFSYTKNGYRRWNMKTTQTPNTTSKVCRSSQSKIMSILSFFRNLQIFKGRLILGKRRKKIRLNLLFSLQSLKPTSVKRELSGWVGGKGGTNGDSLLPPIFLIFKYVNR